MWWIPIAIGTALLLDCLFDESGVREVDPDLADQLVVSFFGIASTGKSSAVKTLYGVKRPASPIPGTTQHVKRIRGCVRVGVTVVDTPGLADIDEAVAQRALAFIDDTDIFVYLVNANGGVNSEVIKSLTHLRSAGRPLLAVINKIDTIDLSEREEFLADQLARLQSLCDDAIAVAIDPHPSISKKPINLSALKDWIVNTVDEEGERLLEEKALATCRST